MAEEIGDENPYHRVNVPDLDEIGYRPPFPVVALLKGLVGGMLGAVAGFFLHGFLLRNVGLDALCVVGALIGLGFALAARKRHVVFGVVCAFAALAMSIFTEWSYAPFIADDSFTFFLAHLNDLSIITMIMIALGTFLAWSIGRGTG